MTFFELGDPAFNGAPEAERAGPVVLANACNLFRDGVADAASVRDLARLPGTRAEMETLADALGAGPQTVLFGPSAKETRLVAASATGLLGRARVVVLATHGLLAGCSEGLAKPVLAMTPPEGDPVLIGGLPDGAQMASLGAMALQSAWINDGLLTASEAARLDLDADWMILSACDTVAGDGQKSDAEGLSGLARAFSQVGACGLLVCQWKVRDDVTARLTAAAVTADPSVPRARALQAAMPRVLQDTSHDRNGAAQSHPAAWAPFQLTGVEGR